MVFSVIKNRICFRGNTWEENLFPDNNNKVSSSGRNQKNQARIWGILRDPEAVSRAGRKGATKVFKHGRKSPWVPSSETQGQSVGSEKAGQKFASTGKNFRLAFSPDQTADYPSVFWGCLGTDSYRIISKRSSERWLLIGQKIALYCCAQSANNDGDGYENVF